MTRSMEHIDEHCAHPDRCPYCGNAEVEGGAVNVEDQIARQPAHCLACNRSWQDEYALEAIIDDRGQRFTKVVLTGQSHPDLADRDLRQREIVPPDRLAQCRATVIGVGAIGRQVALQLTAMGIPWLQLIDHDTVDVVNLAPQGFCRDDLGRPKTEAVGDSCHQINPMLELYERPERFRRSLVRAPSGNFEGFGDIAFVCVDAIETRRMIWHTVKDHVRFFADGRMSAEVVRVLTAADEATRAYYPTTLFAADEAYRGSCTARSTIFTANIAAGLMLEQFARWLRGLPVDADLTLNLLASELTLAAREDR